MNDILQHLDRIINLLDAQTESTETAIHISNKFREFKDAILSNSVTKEEFIQWSRLFAPRLIFDNIGDRNILEEVVSLNQLFNSTATHA